MSGMMDNRLPPPTHLDPEYLFQKYEPLRMATYKKFKDKMRASDREELLCTINVIFISLVNEYNPNRGVDFPYYIKRMLDLRTYHYVSKNLKNYNKEVYGEEIILEDDSSKELLQRIVDLCSLDADIVLGEKHRKLMVGIVIHGKTLKELAEEEGVAPDRLHARLYFLIRKLKSVHKKHIEDYGEDLY